jgi:glycosyltransferase involved in cell wall biosynthesis
MRRASVIVAAFNGEAYIGDCLQSIATQTVNEIEIIIVDDGSSDGTVAAVSNLAATDNRIKVHRTKHSGYPSVARNIGLSLATGEFVGFLDDDDLYHPAKIEKCLRIFNKFPDVDIVFHDLRRFHELPDKRLTFFQRGHFPACAGRSVRYVDENMYLCGKDFYNFVSCQFSPLHTSTVMLRRSVLSQSGGWFPEDMRLCEDTDLWYRILKQRRAAFTDEVLSYYRQRPSSLTDDPAPCLTAAIRLESQNLLRGADVLSPVEQQMLRSKIAAQLLDLGYHYFCRFETHAARNAYRRSMKTRFRAKTLAAYLKTFVPQPVVRLYRQALLRPKASERVDAVL